MVKGLHKAKKPPKAKAVATKFRPSAASLPEPFGQMLLDSIWPSFKYRFI